MEWTMLVPLTAEADVLCIDAADASDATDAQLVDAVKRVVTVGRVEGAEDWSAWVDRAGEERSTLEERDGLFTGDPSFDVVVWNGASWKAEGKDAGSLTWPDLEQAAGAVRPGGYLYFRLGNPLWGSWNPLAGALARRADRCSERSPLIDFASETRAFLRGFRGGCRRRLHALGLDEVHFYQAFPNHRKLHFAIPLEHAGVVDYFLSHLLSRKTRKRAMAVATMRLMNRLGLYRSMYPIYGVLARKGQAT